MLQSSFWNWLSFLCARDMCGLGIRSHVFRYMFLPDGNFAISVLVFSDKIYRLYEVSMFPFISILCTRPNLCWAVCAIEPVHSLCTVNTVDDFYFLLCDLVGKSFLWNAKYQNILIPSTMSKSISSVKNADLIDTRQFISQISNANKSP